VIEEHRSNINHIWWIHVKTATDKGKLGSGKSGNGKLDNEKIRHRKRGNIYGTAEKTATGNLGNGK